MPALRVTKNTREEYEKVLKSRGEEGFYRYILGCGIIERIDYTYPEVMLLDRAEAFFALARRTGNENYFVIGRMLRRAAHRLYRQYHKTKTDHPTNKRFFNLIKS